jgi:hypothetical protein
MRMLFVMALALIAGPAEAATITCRGFAFFYAELQCDMPLPPASAGATFCQVARPITWSAQDSRQTKEQVDRHNRVWKRLCRK